jgi:hypothetical protein
MHLLASRRIPLSSSIDCPFRTNVRPGRDIEVAECQRLCQISGVIDSPLVVVRQDACEACQRESTSSGDIVNPVIASLLHKMCDEIIIRKGILGCDTQKAERLREQAYRSIPFVRSKSNPLAPWRGYHEVTCDQHFDDREISQAPCIHLTRSISHVIGQGFHRSGWPYAVSSLEPLFCKQGILFDDFIEQRFCYAGERPIYTTPWVGVFHHPWHVPSFLYEQYGLEAILEGAAWKESEKQLRGAIALSEDAAKYLSSRLTVPVVAIKHPSEIPEWMWTEEAYLQNQDKKLIQFGSYLRNTRAIYQLPKIRDHEKFRCMPEKSWIVDYDKRISTYWESEGTRTDYGSVAELGYVSNEQYDRFLSSNVVLTELFAASANNFVIECIARNTPLVVNRHPAAVEYLTADYPLFFDDLAEVPALVTTDRVIAAHRYLRGINKEWLHGNHFCNSVREALETMDLSRPTHVMSENIEGWYEVRFDSVLRQIDAQQGFGHIGEIGVHHGKSFVHISNLCRRGELALAVDCFDQQQHNQSLSGNGKKQAFLRNVQDLARVRILEGNSVDFTASDYLAAVEGRFRMFHVDGGHDAETALHDLTEAALTLSEDGVLIVDDVFNADWPAVSEALYRFVAASDIKPFAIAYNKVCLSRRSFVLQSPRYVKLWLGNQVQII